jgi:hypothetical protein
MLLRGLSFLDYPCGPLLSQVAQSIAREEHVWADPGDVAQIVAAFAQQHQSAASSYEYNADTAAMLHKLKTILVNRSKKFNT